MRLIDADKLKNAIQTKEDVSEETWEQLYDSVMEEIDNAPTIEINTNDIQYAYDQGFKSGYELGKEERPQGKWIYHTELSKEDKEKLEISVRNSLPARPQGKWLVTEAYPHKVYCSECYKTYAQEKWEVWKDGSLPRDYCPNCGAKMDNKEADDETN